MVGKIIYILLFVVTFGFFFPLGASADATDWHRWRGPRGDGTSNETIDSETFTQFSGAVWQAQVGIGYSSVALSGSYLYTLGNSNGSDTVYCLDAESGRVVWTHSYSCRAGGYPGPRATPYVDGGVVYSLSREGHLFSLDGETGAVNWRKHLVDDFRLVPPQWGFAGSPVVSGEVLLLNAGRNGIAFQKNSGDLLWKSPRRGAGYASPVLYEEGDQIRSVIFGDRVLTGVDVQTGKTLWTYPWVNSAQVNAADPVVFQNEIFFASGYGRGSSLIDISSGKPELVWSSPLFRTHFSSFILIDGFLYGNDGDARQAKSGRFRCIDWRTGKEQWSRDLGFGSLIASRNYLILLSSTGTVHLATKGSETYNEVAKIDLTKSQYWSPPALHRGKLYIRNVKGDLFCLAVKKG